MQNRPEPLRSERSRRADRRAGFTAVETVVVALIASIAMSVIGGLMISTTRSLEFQTRLARVTSDGAIAMGRLGDEIADMDSTTLLPILLVNAKSIQFQPVTGYSGGANTLGSVTQIQFALANGETLDGTDENGDGRVDEGTLTLTRDGVTTQICGNVLDIDFNTTATGLRADLVVGVTDLTGDVVQRTFSRSWTFRN